jgi:hypothetical protein
VTASSGETIVVDLHWVVVAVLVVCQVTCLRQNQCTRPSPLYAIRCNPR